MKERAKRMLKRFGLYETAVRVYCRAELLQVKARDGGAYLASPFVNAPYLLPGAGDGMPLPPIRLVHLVTNTYSYRWFLESGALGTSCLVGILAKNGLALENFSSILDFGCGCGRMMRHWTHLRGPRLHGTDYQDGLVGWCRLHLPFAQFQKNRLTAELPYDDGTFDFIYAISVFTHLPEELGSAWVAELRRVLKPGGFLYATFMGTTRAPHLRTELRRAWEAGNLMVTGGEMAGENACAAYHPERYVREVFARGFRVVDFVPGGAKDANQDVVLMCREDAERE